MKYIDGYTDADGYRHRICQGCGNDLIVSVKSRRKPYFCPKCDKYNQQKKKLLLQK